MTIRQGQYWNAVRCAASVDPTTELMQRYFISRFSGMRNGGMLSCRNIAGTSRLSTHATGRTGDTMTGTGMPTLASFFLREQLRVWSKELGIQGLIHNRKNWYCNRGREFFLYTGSNPHYDHIHWERIPSMPLTLFQIQRVLQGPPVTGSRLYSGATLRRGSKGDGVDYIQRRLNAHGFKLTVDSYYGAETEAAVKTFQKLAGLAIDGVAGGYTQGRLQ